MKSKNLTFKYYEKSKNTIIDNLDFEIPLGKISILMGKNGSGKSTLAHILSGLYPDNGGILLNGSVCYNDIEINKLTLNKRVEYVTKMFQNPDLQFCMSNLYEELIFSLENIDLDKNEIDKRIKKATKTVGTEKLLHQKFNTLSGGEKQKCALTCIVALESKYVILDEPFANIDLVSAKELVTAIKKLNQESKITFLIIDHIIKRWLDSLDHLFILDKTISEIKIEKENLEKFKKLFDECGIIFPEKIKRKNKREIKSKYIIEIKNFSLENKLLKDINLEIKKEQ